MIKKTILITTFFFSILFSMFLYYYVSNTRLTANVKIKIIDNNILNKDSFQVYGISPFGNTIQLKQKGKFEWEHIYTRTYKKIIVKQCENDNSVVSSFSVVFSRNDITDTLRLENKFGDIDLPTLSNSKYSIYEILLFPLSLYLKYIILFILLIAVYFSARFTKKYWSNIIILLIKLKNLLFFLIKSSKSLIINFFNYSIQNLIIKPIRIVFNFSKRLFLSFLGLIRNIKYIITSKTKIIAKQIKDKTKIRKETKDKFILYNEKRKLLINFSSPKDILLIVCVIFGVIYIAKCILLILSSSYDIGDAEQLFVATISELVNTGVIYKNSNQPPFFTHFYFPIYFYFNYFILKLLNINYVGINQISIVYLVARIISLISLFVSIFIFFKIHYKLLKIDFKIAIISSLIILLITPTPYISVRAEGLSLLFFSLALYYVLKYINFKTVKYIVFVTLFSVLAFFTRQDTAVIFPAFFLLLIFNRNYRHLLIYILFCVLFSLITIFSFIGFENLYNSIKSLFTSEGFSISMYDFSANYFIKIAPLIIASFYISYKWIKNINEQKLVLIILLLLFFIEGTLFCFKLGGLFLYLIPFEIISVIIIANYLQSDYISSLNYKYKIFALVLFLPYFVYNIYFKDTLYRYSYSASIMLNKAENDNQESLRLRNLYNYMKYDLNFNSEEYFLTNSSNPQLIFPHNYILDFEFCFNFQSFTEGKNNSYKKNMFYIKNKYLESYKQQGKIKYIITENNKLNKKFIEKYYYDYYMKKELPGYIVFENKINN